MGRLKVLSGADVCRILAEHGFADVRRRGGHVAMQKATSEGTVTVPVPLHPELKRGTLAAIVRQSRLPRSVFEE